MNEYAVEIVIVEKTANGLDQPLHLCAVRRRMNGFVRDAVFDHNIVVGAESPFIAAVLQCLISHKTMNVQQSLLCEFVLPVVENIAYRLVVVVDHLLAPVTRRYRLAKHLLGESASSRGTLHFTRRDSLLHVGVDKIAVLVGIGYKTLGTEIAAEAHVELVAHLLHGIRRIKLKAVWPDLQYSGEHTRQLHACPQLLRGNIGRSGSVFDISPIQILPVDFIDGLGDSRIEAKAQRLVEILFSDFGRTLYHNHIGLRYCKCSEKVKNSLKF